VVLTAADGAEQEVRYAQLRAQRGGWHGGVVLLAWESEQGARSLAVHDAAALAEFMARAPEPLRAVLRGAQSSRRAPAGRFLLGLAAVALLAAVTLLVVLVLRSDQLVDAAVRRVPLAWEEDLGQLSVAALTAGKQVRTAGPAAQAVETIGTRLAQELHSPYTFRWLLVDDATVNAAAAPGGRVVVFTGLVAATETPEELAGVLAHEAEHVVLRHSLRAMVRGLGLRATLAVVLSGSGELGGLMASMAEQLGTLQFSRRQESEADAAGVRLLESAGIDPRGMESFFEQLAAEQGVPPAFLSTHPASAERARRVQALIGTHPPGAPLGYDWAGVRADAAAPAPSLPRGETNAAGKN
jgi:predicted Zn-dependent protease